MRLSPVSGCNIPPPRPASGLLPRPPGGQSWRYPGRAASGAYHQTLDRGRHRHGGRGQSWRYPGKGRTRENKPLRQLPLQVLPIRWTVGTSPRGWGRRGGGKKPPPLSLVAICRHLRNLASIWRPCPPCLFASHMPASPIPRRPFLQVLPIPWTVGTSPRGVGQTGGHAPLPCLWLQYTPTPPGLWPPPPPPGGAGAVVAIPGENRIRESEPPRRPFLQVLPHTLDRGDISTGVGQTGRGQKAPPLSLVAICRHPPPLPRLSAFNMPPIAPPGLIVPRSTARGEPGEVGILRPAHQPTRRRRGSREGAWVGGEHDHTGRPVDQDSDPATSSPSYHPDRPWVVCGEGIYLLALAPSIKTPQPETDTEMFP